MKILLFILAWIAVIIILCVINKAVCDLKAQADAKAEKAHREEFGEEVDAESLMIDPTL
jgi:hypothetical protein